GRGEEAHKGYQLLKRKLFFHRAQYERHAQGTNAEKDSQQAKVRAFVVFTDIGNDRIGRTVNGTAAETEQEYAKLQQSQRTRVGDALKSCEQTQARQQKEEFVTVTIAERTEDQGT